MVEQSLHGMFLLNKPAGITSNTALQIVKRLFNAEKAGHTGTLDPFACGVLPICLGEATKFSDLSLTANKTYEVKAKLGIKTATGDIEGEIIARKKLPVFKKSDLEKVLKSFRGMITQIPPMYSAIKHEGKPLYASARKGIEVDRKARPVMIYRLDLVNFTQDTLHLVVQCSKGTYIRTLVEDIGDALKCGAHITHLKRTTVGDYLISHSHSLFDLHMAKDPRSFLLPLGSVASGDYPTLKLADSVAHYLFCGQRVVYPHPLPALDSKEVFLTLNDGRFLGLGKILANDWIMPQRLVNPAILKSTSCD